MTCRKLCRLARGTSCISSATPQLTTRSARACCSWLTTTAARLPSAQLNWAGCWETTAHCGWPCSTPARAPEATRGTVSPAWPRCWCSAVCPPCWQCNTRSAMKPPLSLRRAFIVPWSPTFPSMRPLLKRARRSAWLWTDRWSGARQPSSCVRQTE